MKDLYTKARKIGTYILAGGIVIVLIIGAVRLVISLVAP